MDLVKICKTEAVCLILIATVNQVIIGAPKTILSSSGSASLISTFLIFILALLIVLVIAKLFEKFKSLDIIDVSSFLGGKFLKTVIAIAYWGLFFLSSLTCLSYIIEFLATVYFKNYDIIFLTLFFLITTSFAVQKGLGAISKVNYFFTILSFIAIIALVIGAFPHFVPERVFPVLGDGAKNVFLINFSNIFAFGGISYLMFIMPLLKNNKDFKEISIISVIISFIYLFISVLCVLLAFPVIATSSDLFVVYIITKIIEYNEFLERTDAIFIFFWLLSVFSYLSINLFFMQKTFAKITHITNPNVLSLPFSAILLGCLPLIKDVSIYYFIYNFALKWYFIILILISILILVFANIKKR